MRPAASRFPALNRLLSAGSGAKAKIVSGTNTEDRQMLRITLISLTVLIALGSTASYAARHAGDSIPPNCTMDPWTKKLVCHKW